MKECGEIMKSIVYTFFAFLIFITVPKLVSAEEFDNYIGFGIGESSVGFSGSTDKVDDTDTSFKIFGGAVINPNFALELGYIDFGEFSAHYPFLDETDTFEGSAIFAAAIGQFDIAEQVRFFVKMGLAYWSMDFEVDFNIAPFYGSGDGSGLGIFYGCGINFKVSDQVSIRAEWEHYNDVGDGVDITFPGFGSLEVEGGDVNVLSVALAYYF